MKRFLSIMLILFIAISLTVPALGAENTEVLPESYHAPTIQAMMDYIVQTGNIDEQVFHLIANAYLVDPGMVAQLMAEYSEDEITFLAKAIAYDLYSTDRTRRATIPSDGGAWTISIASLIRQQARNPDNRSLMTLQTSEENAVMTLAAGVETGADDYFVTIIVPNNVTPSVAAPLNIEVTVGAYRTSNVSRNVTVTVFKTFEGVETAAALKRVTIPANELGVTTTVSLMFTEPGEYQIQAKIGGLNEVICSSLQHTVAVNGNWHITVELTADRTQLGMITLYDASGAEVSHAKCLGQSAKNLPMNQIDGHTPIGIYEAYLHTHNESTEVYGPYQVVVLEAHSGYVVEQCGHRSGFWIHGGRSSYYEGLTEDDPGFALCPTEGCVRVTNTYQLQLQNEISALISNGHYSRGVVTVTQDGEITM